MATKTKARRDPTRGGRQPVRRGTKRPFKKKGPVTQQRGRKSARATAAVPSPRPVDRPDPARPTAIAIANAALDKKADDVTLLDVRGLTSYADYFVIVTADSERQASAIADHIEETMKKGGVSKVGVEGYESGRWILVDYGDVVAHVMNRESRGFYDLEGLWADAPRLSVT